MVCKGRATSRRETSSRPSSSAFFCNGVETVNYDVHYITIKVYLRTVRNLDGFTVLTAPQLRAARALLGIDQQTLADMAGVSLPTVQRMEASTDYVRGVVATLTKVLEALDKAGIEVIGDGAASSAGGRGVRFKEPSR